MPVEPSASSERLTELIRRERIRALMAFAVEYNGARIRRT
jgi:hypothetical protein